MSIITKEQLRERAREKVKSLEFSIKQTAFADSRAELEEELELARIALASLEAEAVADVVAWSSPNEERTCDIRLRRHDITAGPLYTAPPVPVEDTELQRKASIHDALCQKYNVESLADFVEWQRNHIAELEAAPPAPVGHGEVAVMPDYPGYVMTQRECFQAGKKAGLAEAVTTAYKLRDAVETIRNSGIAIDAEKILAERDALNAPDCWCRTCRPITLTDMRFVVCPECGNKRCPHANDHRHACTGSNEPGQEGSAYPAAPRQEV